MATLWTISGAASAAILLKVSAIANAPRALPLKNARVANANDAILLKLFANAEAMIPSKKSEVANARKVFLDLAASTENKLKTPPYIAWSGNKPGAIFQTSASHLRNIRRVMRGLAPGWGSGFAGGPWAREWRG